MTERDENRRARRLEDVINRLQKGRRPRIGPEDAPEAPAIRAASRLAGARDPYPRMDPDFRRRLAAQLEPATAPRPSRRWALAAAAGIVGGAALGVAGDRLEPALAPARSWTQRRIVPERTGGSWVPTGVMLDDLVEGTPKSVIAGGLPLFLVRQGQEVRAISSVCTHKPCQLFWDADAKGVQCPWGKYQTFSLEGTSRTGELPPLPLAHVRVQEGRVEVYGVS